MKLSKVGAIVPIYNEESTLGNVLLQLYYCKNIDRIVVVDDGSTDQTSHQPLTKISGLPCGNMAREE